ncbi:MAG: histidine kinase [Cyclobacteriaceae bacterium]
MSRLFVHNAFFRVVAPMLFGLMVYLLLLLVNNTVENVGQLFNNQELYVCIGLCYLSFESMRLLILVLHRSMTGASFQQRILVQLSLSLIVSLAVVGLAISAYFKYIVGFSIGTIELNLFLLIYGALSFLYNVLFFSQFFLFMENRSQIDQEQALRERVESEFDTFKNDINPHLLYESLESLILALQKNVDQADELIDYLAGIYRYQLVNRHKELVKLSEEIAATRYLLGLLNYRYHERIQFETNDLDTANSLIIPGSLVVSIDAVIRNTLLPDKEDFYLRLYLEDEYLVLQHRINDKLQLHEESLLAFERLQRSYKFFSDMPFVQVKADRENYIKFPLVRVHADHALDLTA